MTKFVLIVAFVVTTAAPIFPAAPLSISDRVYRETFGWGSIRSSAERTILFGADGRFIHLKAGSGSALTLDAPFKIFLGAPLPDGTYVYERWSEETGRIRLNF